MRQPIQFRQAAQTPVATATAAAAPAPVSFASDIRPLFQQFQGPMMWRFDLTDYEAVLANADTILGRISSPDSPMPPPPFPPLTAQQIATFQEWINQGCPP